MIISFINHGDNQIQYKFVEDGEDILVSPIHELLPGCSLNIHVEMYRDRAELRHDMSDEATHYDDMERAENLLKRLDNLLKV